MCNMSGSSMTRGGWGDPGRGGLGRARVPGQLLLTGHSLRDRATEPPLYPPTYEIKNILVRYIPQHTRSKIFWSAMTKQADRSMYNIRYIAVGSVESVKNVCSPMSHQRLCSYLTNTTEYRDLFPGYIFSGFSWKYLVVPYFGCQKLLENVASLKGEWVGVVAVVRTAV